jgi:hypothetical protein
MPEAFQTSASSQLRHRAAFSSSFEALAASAGTRLQQSALRVKHVRWVTQLSGFDKNAVKHIEPVVYYDKDALCSIG